MIFFHELGHFLAARWRGLYVDRFQIWFGKPIWKKKINGVQYGLGWLPAGGFVSLPQMAPMEEIEGEVEIPEDVKLKEITPKDKIIVAAAGPIFSFLLAVIFAVIVWFTGKPVDQFGSTVIGYVMPDSPAAQAGIVPGDQILAVDGTPVTSWVGNMSGVKELIMLGEEEKVTFTVKTPSGEVKDVECGFQIPETSWWQRKALRQVGLIPATPFAVDKVLPDSPAALAGLKSGDVVEKANGQKVWSFITLEELLKSEKPFSLEVRGENGETRTVEVHGTVPSNWQGKEGARPILGALWKPVGSDVVNSIAYPTPLAQIKQSVKWMGDTLQKVAAPNSSVGIEHLSGPVGIANHFYTILTVDGGWRIALWFAVILNINLAILNMLPLPVVDGGHVVINTFEWVTKKTISLKVLGAVQMGFILLLGFVFIFVTSKDVGELFNGKSASEKLPEPIFQSSSKN